MRSDKKMFDEKFHIGILIFKRYRTISIDIIFSSKSNAIHAVCQFLVPPFNFQKFGIFEF